MLFKNATGQGVYFYAHNISGDIAYTGGAATISGFYSLDGAAKTYFADTTPTEIAGGGYWQPLSQSETNGNAFYYGWTCTLGNVQIDPIIGFTQGGAIPFVAAGSNGGLPTVDASGWVQSDIRAVLGSGVELFDDLLNVNVSGWAGATPRALDAQGQVYANTENVTVTGVTVDTSNLSVNVTGWLGVAPLPLSNQYVQSTIPMPLSVNVSGWNGVSIRNPDVNGNLYMVTDKPLSASVSGWLGNAVKALDANQNMYVVVYTSGIGRDSFANLSELNAAPSTPYNPLDMLEWVFERSFHENMTTSGVDTIMKADGTTPLASGILSDNGTTFTRNKYS